MVDQEKTQPVPTPAAASAIEGQVAQDLPDPRATLSPQDLAVYNAQRQRMFNAITDPDYVDEATGLKADSAANVMSIIHNAMAMGKGLDINVRDDEGGTLLMALSNSFGSKRSLYEKDTAQIAHELIEDGIDVNAQDSIYGDSALSNAAAAKNPDLLPPLVLQEILDAPGIKVDLPNKDGITALWNSSIRLNIPAARALLERGANPDNASPFDGTSVLKKAIFGQPSNSKPIPLEQREKFVALLLKYHASLEGEAGNQAFFGAAAAGSTAIMEQLQAGGYQFDPFATIQGQTLMHRGAPVKDEKGNNVVASRTIWDQMINETVFRNNVNPPEELARWYLEHRHYDIHKAKYTADIEGNIFYIGNENTKSPPPPHDAGKKLVSAQYLLDLLPGGPNATPEEKERRQQFLDLPGQHKQPPLLASIYHGGDRHIELTRLFLREGADVSKTDENLNNAMHEAITKEAEETVGALLDVKLAHDLKGRGVDLLAKNKDGLTPKQVAQSMRKAKQEAAESLRLKYEEEGKTPKEINTLLAPYQDSVERLDRIIGTIEDELRDPRWKQWHQELEAEKKQREKDVPVAVPAAVPLPHDMLHGIGVLRGAQNEAAYAQQAKASLLADVAEAPALLSTTGLPPVRRSKEGLA